MSFKEAMKMYVMCGCGCGLGGRLKVGSKGDGWVVKVETNIMDISKRP